jgi:hypothetical protein
VGSIVWNKHLYDADLQQNLDAARSVAHHLRQGGISPYEADVLAVLGGLEGTNGEALRQAAVRPSPGFDSLRLTALTDRGNPLGHRINGSPLTAEEVYSRMAALGLPDSPDPISFHCPEGHCPSRAQVMIEQMQQVGVIPENVWALMQGNPLTGQRLQPRYLEDNSRIPAVLGGDVEWFFHTAPVVLLEDGGWHVIDPSLSWSRLGGPISVDRWHQQLQTLPGSQFRQQLGLGVSPPGTTFPAPGAINSVTARTNIADIMAGGPISPLPGSPVRAPRPLLPL